MKRYTIFIYSLLLFTLAAVGIRPVQAQQQHSSQYALYNYRNDGDFNAWLNIDIDSITYSCIDTLGVEHDDVVVQEVWTPDSLYRIPLEAIDSIGFRTPEPVYKDNIFHIRKYHMPFILEAEGLSLTISRTIDKDSIPVVGQIIISDVFEEPLPRGFSGRVLSVESTSGAYKFTCEAIALTDIFERLVMVGRSESFTPEEIQQARKRSSLDETDWDGIIPFEVGKFSVNIPSIEGLVSNSKSDMTLATLSLTPKFCVSFVADIRPFVHSYVKVLFENKSVVSVETHLKVSSESSLTETKKTRIYITKVPIPLITGVLYGEVAISGDLALKGNIDLKASFSKNLYNGDEYEWSTSDFWNIKHKRYDKDPKKSKKGDDNNDDNQWQSDVTLSMNGSFGFGASLELVLFAISENTLEISNSTTVGPEISGSLQFSRDGLKDGTLYSTLKKTNVSFTPLKLSDEVKFNICMREFSLGSFSKDFGKKSFKLFPDFTQFTFPSFDEYMYGDYNPFGLYTKVTNDVIPIIPLKLGIGRYDRDNNLIDEYFAPDFYQYEEEWDNRKLYYDMSSFAPDETYIFHPLIRIWGLKALQLKAMPQTVIKIPTLSLSSSSLKLTKGDIGKISIVDGWGSYMVESLNNNVVWADIVNHHHFDGSISKEIEIGAKAVGRAEVQVVDRRSQETVSIMVEVVEGPVAQGIIKVDPTKIDFGTVKMGETKTENFTILNTGQYELAFKVAKASAPFEIPEAGKEFTLPAGKSKEFAVSCSGLEPEDGNKEVFIRIGSDASNDNADFGITLIAGTSSVDEAYAVLKDNILTFYCDDKRDSWRYYKIFDLNEGDEFPAWIGNNEGGYTSYYDYTKVIFDPSFSKAKPTSTYWWFYSNDYYPLTEIQGIEYLNTSNVTNMGSMFGKCKELKQIDVSHFDTSNVTDMSFMFYDCENLTELNLSKFNTSKVENMEGMFKMCKSIKELDLSNFDTSHSEIAQMFSGCESLTKIHLKNLNTSNVTNMNCLFADCHSLSELDLSSFDTSNVTDMSAMFRELSLATIDLSTFDTSKVKYMGHMFRRCNNLKTIICSKLWNTEKVTNSNKMFDNCTNLVGGKGTKYDSNHTDAEYARIDGGPGKPGYFTDVNGSQSNVPAEAVDLGLPSGTLWASCNVGATKPEEIGGYYAWGETEEKKEYEWSNYSLCSGKEGTCHDVGENISGTQYDVAHVRWGDKWRMPTIDEWQEVIVNCTNQVVTLNGAKGLRLTSRKNGKSIFLPFTGCRWDSGTYYPDNIYCWLSNISSKSNDFANYLQYREGMGIGSGRDLERFIGLPVRPVFDSSK